jgi:hypothetical protein
MSGDAKGAILKLALLIRLDMKWKYFDKAQIKDRPLTCVGGCPAAVDEWWPG